MTPRIEFGRFIIEVVALDRLDLLAKNARFMPNEMFRRLVENIQQDGQISQIPFCVPVGDRFKVLSGNHRVKAARSAGLVEIPIIYPKDSLSTDQELAVQLSHNAIAGQDDPVLLKELWNELTTVAGKLYSGLDDKTLATLAAISLPSLSEVKLDFRTLSFIFLPDERDALQTLFEQAKARVTGDPVYLARYEAFDRLLDALATTKAAHNIKNAATALLVFLSVAERHLDDLSEGWWDDTAQAAKHKEWIPLSTVVGSDRMPADAAGTLKRAVDKLQAIGDVTQDTRWRALEWLAAHFLASVEADAEA